MSLVVLPDLDISRPPLIIEAQPAMVPTATALTKMLHRFKKRGGLYKHGIMNKPLLYSHRDQANFKNYNEVLKRDNNKYYLYIDIIDYYYKNKLEYKTFLLAIYKDRSFE